MEPLLTRILARNRHQAMDWSLVLISQGIESTIDAHAEAEEWGLLVTPQDYERALQIIEQYQAENAAWPWQQKWVRPAIMFDWGSLAWVLLLLLFFRVGTQADLHSLGTMDNLAVRQGQWWRLFTAIWLHADFGHLASNAAIGFVLLGLTMGRYGTGIGLLTSYFAGAAGNAGVYLLGTLSHRSLGASGMVMGSLGLLAVQTFSLWKKGPHGNKYVLSGIAGGFMLFVLLGLTPGTDVLAHLGGFIGGVFLGGLVSWALARGPKRWADLVAGVLFAMCVIVPWWLALSHAKPN
jgi:membrane associated rhomboid family serine protease